MKSQSDTIFMIVWPSEISWQSLREMTTWWSASMILLQLEIWTTVKEKTEWWEGSAPIFLAPSLAVPLKMFLSKVECRKFLLPAKKRELWQLSMKLICSAWEDPEKWQHMQVKELSHRLSTRSTKRRKKSLRKLFFAIRTKFPIGAIKLVHTCSTSTEGPLSPPSKILSWLAKMRTNRHHLVFFLANSVDSSSTWTFATLSQFYKL